MAAAKKLTSQSDFQKIDLEELRSLQNGSEDKVERSVFRLRELALKVVDWCMVKPPLEPPVLAQADR